MFFKLITRNIKKSHSENLLFMISLVVSVIAFYVVLSINSQDVVIYLQTLESDALNKLIGMIGVLYVFTLIVLFFLIYFANKYQIGRRSHELGVYMMMGMRRSKLFAMLLAEDLSSSFLALLIGIPSSVLLTEMISLFTAKIVGVGYLGHQTTFSVGACVMTCVGFALVKLMAFLVISFKITRQELGTLLTDAPENNKELKKPSSYLTSCAAGIVLLACAYIAAISGMSWKNNILMLLTLVSGMIGTLLLFRGISFILNILALRSSEVSGANMDVFNFRQVQDTVLYRSGTLAVCSLLALAAMVCLGSGIGTFQSYGLFSEHYADYTFRTDGDNVDKMLEDSGIKDRFTSITYTRIGYIRAAEDFESAFNSDEFYDRIGEDFYGGYRNTFPYLIDLDKYNELLVAAGEEAVELDEGEVGLYMENSFTNDDNVMKINEVLSDHPRCTIDGDDYRFGGTLQHVPVTTDYMITISMAVIVPHDIFEKYTLGDYTEYCNCVLDESKLTNGNYIQTFDEINQKLEEYEIEYDCYQTNMGRQLFYLVGASYITIYLAIIFLIISNTILGVQFLMGQRKTSGRYKSLIKLGADIDTLKACSNKQIDWFFGIPLSVAFLSALFGIRAVYSGILSSRAQIGIPSMMLAAMIVIIVTVLVEYLYIALVKRSAGKYLGTLMVLDREE